MIDGQQEIMGINELPSPNSIEATCKPFRSARRMSPEQIKYIQWKIKIHQICIIQRGKHAIILKRINPPRTMYWKPEYGNFISYWKTHVDKWASTNILLKDIIDEYAKRRDIIEMKKISEANKTEENSTKTSKEQEFDDEDELELEEYNEQISDNVIEETKVTQVISTDIINNKNGNIQRKYKGTPKAKFG
jgi:hypothetical protein